MRGAFNYGIVIKTKRLSSKNQTTQKENKMPKKEMTPEEKKAFGAKMKAAREAKKAVPSTAPSEVSVEDLVRQINELKQQINQGQTAQPEINARGRLVGTYERYKVDPKFYPDPRERLSLEPRLGQFAFPVNYELDWGVTTTTYETIDGVRTREPRFSLELRRIIKDADGNPTAKRAVLNRLTFHEDPDAAITVAQQNGLNVEDFGEKNFLDEMRYLRARDWLLECFYPPKITSKQNRTEEVIGNRLVEVFTISSETPEKMPFDQITKQL